MAWINLNLYLRAVNQTMNILYSICPVASNIITEVSSSAESLVQIHSLANQFWLQQSDSIISNKLGESKTAKISSIAFPF